MSDYQSNSPQLGQKGTAPSVAGDSDISGASRPDAGEYYSIGAHEIIYKIEVPMFFHLLPNWKYAVSLKFGFKTVLARARYGAEQRKPLMKLPMRTHRFTVTTKEYHQLIWNYLISIHSNNINIPIFTEPCIPSGSGSLYGESTINLNDITHYYNMQNMASYIAIIDRRNIITSQIYELSTVGNDSIVLTTAIGSAFQQKTTVIFPVFECYLTNKSRTDITDKMTKIDLEFTEFK